eukprot:scaffold108454_cov37-Cyclotella_meneghiniana.AAC.3
MNTERPPRCHLQRFLLLIAVAGGTLINLIVTGTLQKFLFDDHQYSHGASISIRSNQNHSQNLTETSITSSDHINITTLSAARSYKLTPIQPTSLSATHYTIRINTWHRNEQLLLSINHHAKCEGVHAIHVIWCDANHDPPAEIIHHVSGKVVVERHAVNSLNERWRIMDHGSLAKNTTLGILSLDDDVLRPCEALDAAFVRWTRHPDRIVGFDARMHYNDTDSISSSGEMQYSIVLPSKSAFLHRDYLHLYITALPRSIYQYVEENFQCEDIAMSYMVSSLTGGKPPLMANYWAVKSMTEIYSKDGISGAKSHLDERHGCVTDFAELLGLKDGSKFNESGLDYLQPLQKGPLFQSSFMGYGSEPESWNTINVETLCPRLQTLVSQLQRLESLEGQDKREIQDWYLKLKEEASRDAMLAGMVRNTQEWKDRWLNNRSVSVLQ